MDDEFSAMEYSGQEPYDDSQDSETQSQTQSTQQATQPIVLPVDSHLWGYLQPVNDKLRRIDFWRSEPTYTIGRNAELNKILLPGFKVSNRHCELTWDGEAHGGSVVALDLSSNGTFINNQKIGKGTTRILREGNEIAFGTPMPQPQNPFEDYRFIYRHTACGPPTTGLYAFYDVSTELGKGSFATVMKAVNRQTGVWYAVKMIKDKTNRGGEQGQIRNAAIAREISIMEKLKHKNICELKEVFLEDTSQDINLVLELVEGGDLLEYILSREGLCELDAKHITFQICDALSYIHAQGIAHRDLKPENVLLTRDDPPVVKVADFGLAKIVDSLTMLRTMCGTPSYLAPEVVKQTNQEGYDNLVDSWSVGVIVFSMLTNASPFIEDEGQTNLRTRIIERTIDWQTLRSQQLSEEAFDFITSLLQEDPLNRMSLTEALDHPWLRSYRPVYPSTRRQANAAQAGVTQGFIGLQIQPSADGSTGSIRREGSRGAPLQRRSDVLSRAAEGDGPDVPQPPPDMIAQANATQAKKGKRVRLTPLEEDDMETAASSRASGSNSGGGSGQGGGGGSSGTRSKRPRLRSEA